jgi:hypothetical protein
MAGIELSRRGLCGFSLAALTVSAEARARGLSRGNVEQWGIAEVELKGPRTGNPFLDVSLSADFSQNGRVVTVAGFYDGDGIYRLRFSPPATGIWHYVTKSNVAGLNERDGRFDIRPAAKTNHGPVGVANQFHFAYADGTPYRQIGTTSYAWTYQDDGVCTATLKTLDAAPFNKLRMAIFPNGSVRFEGPYPFAGTPGHFDLDRFDPIFFRRFETYIGALLNRGIEADIILFHPYDGDKFGFDNLPAAVDEHYLRYVVARLAAYRNVWWSMANEYDVMKHKTEADFDRFFKIVQNADPYGRLRSIHHLYKFYDNNKPWVTHASIQSPSVAKDDERASLLRDIWRKPVILDEVQYEGTCPYRWGRLSGEEMVSRFWAGTIAGVYVGHGEYIEDEKHFMWVGTGGVLHGTSAPRLAFLRQILEQGPKQGVNPIDKWYDHHLAGAPGAYYLRYFGKDAPPSWDFVLPQDGLNDGMRFTVEVLDTWNMTVTKVPGVFVAKRKNQYDFADANGRAVPLPNKPWIALRITKA